jgi:ABC-type branched-subunit amino acid transport system substrate-binding protein
MASASRPVWIAASFGPEGRFFVRSFGATQPGQSVDQTAIYAAQAASVLLSAIARSDGTRASVTRELFRTRVSHGILGDFAFDANGDTTSAPVTILRALHGGGATTLLNPEGAVIARVVRPPRRLVR